MITKTISVLLIATVLVASATITSLQPFPAAEALKSSGNPILKTGSSGSPVCGDKLCSEVRGHMSAKTSMKQPDLKDTSLPIDIPLTKGYAHGKEIYYISTEASVEDVANHLTDLTGFRVTYTPALEFAPKGSLAQIYAFTNGIKGPGALGFQPQVADSQPGDEKYSPLWNVNAVTWNEGVEPRELKSEEEIMTAMQNNELSISEAGVIVNCPFVKWDGGQLQIRKDTNISDDDPYGGGQVTSIDTKNMKVTFVAHRGFAPNGDTIYYIATDASVKEASDALGVTHVPKVQNTISNAASSDLYVFTNGLEGNGPLGFQASIGSTTAGDKFYSPLWRIQTATWTNEADAKFLTKLNEIQTVSSNGKLDTGLAGFVVNCPFVEVDAKMKDQNADHMSKDMVKPTETTSSMKGDLTSPSNGSPFGGAMIGTYSVLVSSDDKLTVTASIKTPPVRMVLEGWLVDTDSDYKLSLGRAGSDGKLTFSQYMVNPWIYDVLVFTEEPIRDTNPTPNVPVGGALLDTPFGK